MQFFFFPSDFLLFLLLIFPGILNGPTISFRPSEQFLLDFEAMKYK